jgi:hypothetical protein
MDNSTERSNRRAATLRKLAGDHGVDPQIRSTAGEALSFDLASGPVGAWSAVSYSPAGEEVYLYPHFETLAAAREFAECLLEDPSFAELPVEVISLDDGSRQIARLGVLAWDSVS